ncbi:LTA synthase family protein [Achromobacter sp. D10]|uniref:LTA synthase family protein n=1 Tax=Achromobacter sp. D10 TaxID=3110765 RepID=UPI002B48937A|nr:LTA synthase family protein [Achromobacter sp. D10]MEB3097122.1 LTA synthase family protein [Achromobacter sp. D10]
MIDAFWIPLLPPYLIGLVLSFLVEAILTPRPVAPWRRPLAAVGVHIGVWTLAFALELMLFRRPYFAVANVLAIELVIVLVSNAKYQALREPFVYQDFEYFTDAIKHPRLYLPFFGVGRALAAGGGYFLALWAGLTMEESVTAGAGLWLAAFSELMQESVFAPIALLVAFLSHSTAFAIAGLAIAWWAGKSLRNSSADVDADLTRSGLIATLWAYALEEKQHLGDIVREHSPFGPIAAANKPPEQLPHLVVVQSESFVDARRLYPHIRRDVLAQFDLLCAESAMHGLLNVDTWGANTVRTEFAFLSGIPASMLGVHRFNPYRKIASEGVPTIASYLKGLGYRTICVHPYHGEFYRRNRVLPLLGFDEFMDISHFSDARRDGPYVGDLAVAECVDRLLRDAGQPVYVHVITMENHGPLHWEHVSESEIAGLLEGPIPEGCEDLLAYVRHLRNADEMFARVAKALQASARPGAMCVYGDHVPVMTKVYEQLGYPTGDTDFLIWQSHATRSAVSGKQYDSKVDQLARRFLEVAGVRAVRVPPAR